MESIYSKRAHKVHGLLQNMEERLHMNVVAIIVIKKACVQDLKNVRLTEGVSDCKQIKFWRQA